MRWFLPCSLPLLLLLSSCSAGPEAKLGAEGERCEADNHCRVDFICHRSLCQSPANIDPDPDSNPDQTSDPDPDFSPDSNPDFTPDPEPDFAPDPNPVTDPDPEPEPPRRFIDELCADLCERIVDCGFDPGQDIEGCARDCANELEGFEESALCLLELSCDELVSPESERCFDDGTDPNPDPNPEPDDELNRCFNVCEEVISCPEFVDRCGDDVVEEAIEVCFDACFDEDARQQILAAEGLPCEVVVPLAIDGFGLSDRCN